MALLATSIFIVLLILPLSSIFGAVYPYSKDNSVIGYVKEYKIKGNESLIEIAREFGLGYNEITAANPEIDPFIPAKNTYVKIPSSWILPNIDNYNGIIINLSEMRLYYFFKKDKKDLLRTFPIGIGDEGKDTPVGNFKIIEKKVNPSWHVPESIRKERPQLPKVVPPGKDNPLGSHALRLSLNSYLIHGTNRPWAVGRRVTNGCIRLYPEDIPELFKLVPIGTPVTIIRQPVKVGIKNNKIYLEVHEDYIKDTDYLNEAKKLLAEKKLLNRVNTERLYQALKLKNGIPTEISD